MSRAIRKTFEQKNMLNKSNHNQIANQEFIVSDKAKISRTFLNKGSQFLQLPTLNFKEVNIFDNR
jgi:hypothetical protein